MENFSLADIGALLGNRDNSLNGFGGSGVWVLVILFALIFGNGGFGFGGNGERAATVGDVQRATDFQSLERQNNETVAAVRQSAYDTAGAIKDGHYNILGELRDLQSATANGFARQQECCCEGLRAIDGVNYNAAMNTAAINANTTAQTQKILDALSQNKIDTLQAQVNELKMQGMFCGIPRISPYGYGIIPQFASCGGCGCGNI